ncbi:MAG: SDR family oxidoreductase [Candidatus Aenigmatarchaeota archaeon]|nr:MAG: SDR family oxidoreductase [Candidatus Aenigmarchaeota archaeon]
MTTILVTGGAGFIGSNLVEDLVSQGYNIKVLDNFETGKRENLSGLENKIELVKGDIRDMRLVKNAVKGVDYISHQAALPSMIKSIEEPIPTTEVNILGTLNILLAARDSGVQRIVYASSSSVYAGVDELPKRESMNMVPTSPYGLTKVANEHYFKIFHDIYGLKSVGLRYFNIFGPKQDPKSEYAAVIPKFINLMLNYKEPPIYGDGKQTRDFSYVKDAAIANIISLKAKRADGYAYNIAGGKQTSINDLVRKINEMLGKNIKPIYENPKPGDPKYSEADISEAVKNLGYKPKYGFGEGLKLTVEWFSKRR